MTGPFSSNGDMQPHRIAVVIPCFKVKAHILDVIAKIPSVVDKVFVVDDACPENSGTFVEAQLNDPRVKVLYHTENKGVGGAVMTGYEAAISDGFHVMVKIDGDGQMDPSLIPLFVSPILTGAADYTKGNRFFDLQQIHEMPFVRVFGNALLSFATKISAGYWNIFDPTNGYTAIHSAVCERVLATKVSERFFFETDMLFRLNSLRAVVLDIPMDAVYGDEKSNLKIRKVIGEFLVKHFKNFIKRIFYNYYLRDLCLASIQLPVGLGLLLFGLVFGLCTWNESALTGTQTPVGTVMLVALSITTGLQMTFAFIGYDIASTPTRPIQHSLRSISEPPLKR